MHWLYLLQRDTKSSTYKCCILSHTHFLRYSRSWMCMHNWPIIASLKQCNTLLPKNLAIVHLWPNKWMCSFSVVAAFESTIFHFYILQYDASQHPIVNPPFDPKETIVFDPLSLLCPIICLGPSFWRHSFIERPSIKKYWSFGNPGTLKNVFPIYYYSLLISKLLCWHGKITHLYNR